MTTRALTKALAARLEELLRAGRLKGSEAVICGFIAAGDDALRHAGDFAHALGERHAGSGAPRPGLPGPRAAATRSG